MDGLNINLLFKDFFARIVILARNYFWCDIGFLNFVGFLI